MQLKYFEEVDDEVSDVMIESDDGEMNEAQSAAAAYFNFASEAAVKARRQAFEDELEQGDMTEEEYLVKLETIYARLCRELDELDEKLAEMLSKQTTNRVLVAFSDLNGDADDEEEEEEEEEDEADYDDDQY